MEKQNFVHLGWRVLFLGLSLVSCGLFASADCQAGQVALLVQCTPSQGGEVAPAAGIHYFALGSEVKLVAIPKPGYQFLYWLGDVDDAESMNTVANLEGPKIIIAVFAEIPEEIDFGAGAITVGSRQKKMAGGGGVRVEGSSPPSSRRPSPRPRPRPKPIPEPATVLLFGLGAAMLRRKRRHS